MSGAGAPDGPSVDGWDPRWTNDAVLADGSTARIRPIVPADGPGLLAFHGRQSRESIYFRFFSPRPHLTDDDVATLTTVDGIDRMAFVAERGDELIGIARYDRYQGQVSAEAAFFTDDEMKGRGIATLLLEYLAAYAREVGIHQFTAHVLPENRRMARVFRQAGFATRSTFADGVIEVTLDIDPSSEAAAAMTERARLSERQSVARLLEPEAVAVIGAGRSTTGIGHRVLRNLLDAPFTGPVHVVHPTARSVAGVRAYPTIGDVPDRIDLAVVAVPAVEVPAVVEQCGRARVAAVVVISAGFAEIGPDGREAQDRLVAIARRYGTRVLGPNCLGVVNTDPEVALMATFADVAIEPGRVGLLSQSGTLGSVILELAHRMGIGISNFVAVGNKADLSGNDLLQYWLDDDRTDVVLLYLESFGNPRRFARNVRQVARRKPVFAVRAGDALGAASGDDGWLDDDTVDALLRQTGVVRVPTVKALLDAALLSGAQPVPAGPGVAVVGNTGGSVSMAADACIRAGLVLAELSDDAAAVVDELRLHGRSASNPVELAYDATPADYERVLSAVLVDAAVDAVLVVHAPYAADDRRGLEAALGRVAIGHPDQTIVACVYGPHAQKTPGGVPIFDFPDDAAYALGSVVRYGAWRADTVTDEAGGSPSPGVADLVRDLLQDRPQQELDPLEARALLRTGGVGVVPVTVLRSSDELGDLVVEQPVALKAAAHRAGAATRATGVALDLAHAAEVRSAAAGIVDGLGDTAWPMVLQPMVAPGVDVRVAVRTHPIVGHTVSVGPGGGAGRYAPQAIRVLPISPATAEAMIEEAGLVDLGAGARKHVVHLVASLGRLVEAAPEITDIECDPVIVRDDAADVVEVKAALALVQRDPVSVRRLP